MCFAKEADVKAGMFLVADGGFTCLAEGDIREVKEDDGGLYIECSGSEDNLLGESTHHYLDGQLDDGDEYIGLTIKTEH